MDFFANRYDHAEGMIFQNYLKIKAVFFQKNLNLMLVVLNNGKVLKITLAISEILNNATQEDLANYRLLGNGAGIYWPFLNEDFSLDDFLQDKLINSIK
ncbi:MAG: DUF2442 domain-containing protein [Candidatus Cyclobacteriaceae bacterium M2_1C_046]